MVPPSPHWFTPAYNAKALFYGPSALGILPGIGHLNVTLMISINGLTRGPDKLLIQLEDPTHSSSAAKTVSFY